MTTKPATAKNAKRKAGAVLPASRKKTKTQHLSPDELPWKVVNTQKTAGSSNIFDGIMELEEVEGVEVVYEGTQSGRVAKFKVSIVQHPW